MLNTDKKISEFERLMNCGHGRCFDMLPGNEELYRSTVLYGCLNDISFDMQCEGSRGLYMYNLAAQYDEPEYFLQAAAEKLLTRDINDDRHTINHLCDFIAAYAYDGNSFAADTLEKKYRELYSLLMTTRKSQKHMGYIECFEYISIVLMQLKDFDRLTEIAADMGAYFIRRRRTEDEDLRWYFGWFFTCAKDKYSDGFLRELNADSAETRRFIRVMSFEEAKEDRKEKPDITAGDIIGRISEGGRMFPRDVWYFGRKSSSEDKRRVAEMAVSEKDIEKKAELLYMFSEKENPFPLDPEILIGYAESEDERLKNAAIDALCVIRADKVHELALEILRSTYSVQAVYMLIKNYKESDHDLLMNILNGLEIDRENKSDWHGIVLSLLDEAENGVLPDEALMFIYDRSLCSCCREYAFIEMRRRNILTDKIIDECLFDCGEDIRKAAEEINQTGSTS
ncbi:MAG: hypothetical protein ACI4J6_02050 [Oscillospiraceae bacterium]